MFSSEYGSLYVATDGLFWIARQQMLRDLLEAPIIYGAKWQQLDVSQSDAHATHELLNVSLWYDMPETGILAQRAVQPDLPWAEAHFRERVGGEPINPGVEHANWPYHAGKVDLHQHGGKYDHNYMERYWASKIEVDAGILTVSGVEAFRGYRFSVGDLGDVVEQLRADPTTRQAYLPVWFPEDTGATQGQRVPCTLGYHFIVRDGKLHCQYNIRSCDVYRHFTNDVYMTVRLAQWVRSMASGFEPGWEMGQLTMHVVSMHAFVGDVPKIRERWL